MFEAYDKDLASSDLLGSTDPLDLVDYVGDDKVNEFDLELFEKNGQKAGNVRLSTQLVFVQPDPPLNPDINYNCKLQIDLVEASFLKDTDTFGKQDPYLQFHYDGIDLKTEVKDDAGLQAKFNEQFVLENIDAPAKNGEELVIKAFDKDVGSSDLLGSANPITYIKMVADR